MQTIWQPVNGRSKLEYFPQLEPLSKCTVAECLIQSASPRGGGQHARIDYDWDHVSQQTMPMTAKYSTMHVGEI